MVKKSTIKKKKNNFNKNRTKQLTILALPAIICLIIFNYLPVFGLILAFKDYRFDKGIFGSDWVGFKNFDFFFKSQDAWRITRNTLVLNFIFIITVIGGSVILAIFLSEVTKKATLKIYQTAMFFPYFLSWPVVAYVVYAFLNYDLGIFNTFLGWFGKEPVMWYFEAKKWPGILTLVNFWKSVGYNTLIFYAGLMAIDPALYEAASIDGANILKKITKITIPMLKPLIIMMTLLRLGKIFYADFGLFYMVTRNTGVLYSTTDVIDTYVYRALSVIGDTGMATAAGFYQAIVGFIVVLTFNGIVRKYSKDSALF